LTGLTGWTGYFVFHILYFIKIHSNSRNSLECWYKIVAATNFSSFTDLRKSFHSADKVGKLTVFDIGGNKFRLVAAIHYNRKKLYIRDILLHKDYDKNKWKE